MRRIFLVLMICGLGWFFLFRDSSPEPERPRKSLVCRVIQSVAAFILLKDAIFEPPPPCPDEQLATDLETFEVDPSLAAAAFNMDEQREVAADGNAVLDFRGGW